MDEPTSGLDSYAASAVVDALCALGGGGGGTDVDASGGGGNGNGIGNESGPRAVVITIHQPPARLFARFDRVALLTPRGETAYAGPAAGALPHFAACGLACPPGLNPGEPVKILQSTFFE